MDYINHEYQSILTQWESELEDTSLAIFRSLRISYPAARSRRLLILDVFGVEVPEESDLNDNSMDRRIRKTIKYMFEELGIPITSSYNSEGYKIDLDPQSIQRFIDELAIREQGIARRREAAVEILEKVRLFGRDVLPSELPAENSKLKQLEIPLS